jgi:pimeloyl-[acyl-carrier protein] methyl ester esterase
MKQLFIKKENSPRLLLFFAGWGSDENLFRRTVAEGYDCLLCFDYRTLEFDYSLLDGYREIRLLAWSMGVWVAGQILSGRTYPWEMKLAVNGTPFPIDDRRGYECMKKLQHVLRKTSAYFSENISIFFLNISMFFACLPND